jgi:hypothetical protein
MSLDSYFFRPVAGQHVMVGGCGGESLVAKERGQGQGPIIPLKGIAPVT